MEASKMPLMKSCCKTCPFKPTEEGHFQNPELAGAVIERNLFQSQQICHHPRLHGKEETHRCRGYYNYAFDIYDRMGLDPENNILNSDNPHKK